MAINKNFVIKNGVQVSTDLIIGDADTNKVGIGTTVPHYDLHVGVARGSRGGIGVTDAVVAGVATINQLSVTGISTFAGALDVNSTVDFAGDVVFNGTNDITYDQSESALVFNDGAAIRVGTGSDLSIMHDGSNSILRDNGTGGIKILGSQVEIGAASVNETMAKFTENGNVELYHDNTKHFEVVAIGATVFGDFIVSGVTTSKELNVSSGSTFGGNVDVNANIDVSGNSVLNGDVDLGNATSDTITATGRFDSDIVPSTDGARDLGASGLEFKDLFIDGTAHIDTLDVDEAATVTTQLSVGSGVTAFANGNVAAAGIVTANGGVKVGSAISIHTNGNLGVTGILTAKEFVGVFTSAGGAGVGIGSTTGLVGYGFTFINFKGPGVSTVFASSTTGIATIFFQGGGGGVGAAGTWTPEGSIGVSTSKSVGVNTTALNDPDVQGIGNSFQGLYIGNGMLMNDNALNGNHYIGTAFGGMMAGPVTINGVLTVDGSYVVV